ncbi:MAG: hypothetical protein H0X37_06620 [Herpetosiphonaceae bacterium]|nr:hypothetical protein [Herpetosiphonaceae bacterium]
MVPLVQGEWTEVRTLAVGEVAAAVERAGEVVIETEELSYFSRLAASASFSRLTLGELHRRGLERAGQVGVVVDGAEWCQTLIDLQAPLALRILDFPHAAEYVSAMGQNQCGRSAVAHQSRRDRPLPRPLAPGTGGCASPLTGVVRCSP